MTDADLQVEELASQCLQRMEEEGAEAIESLCRQHPELAHKIRGMISQLQQAGLVEGPAEAGPQEFGDFRILKRLGGGGMGVVYLAEQKSLKRRVALKLMRPGFHQDERSRERFRREIEAISKLDHAGICTVYEAGEEDGRPYLAMRYIDGESLAQLIEQRRQASQHSGSSTASGGEPGETIHLFEKVARALHAAHEAGLVHRDIKPGNIMIDRNGEPVILDFGLVRDEETAQQSLTATGDLLGTPAYMSPEQISGDGSQTDRSTDLYSLGVALYECLTLRWPFEAPTRESLYRRILEDEPPDPRKYNRQVGSELCVVLSKALEKVPFRRFATALEFAEELRRIRVHQPIQTRRPGVLVRALRWSQRNRTAAGILVTTVIGLLVSLWFLTESRIAQTSLRVLALMAEADKIRAENPVLAFKLERKALELRDEDRGVVARIQETMFQLDKVKKLDEQEGPLDLVLYSRNGKFLLVGGDSVRPTLYLGDGTFVAQLDRDLGPTQRQPAAFSHDESELALGGSDGRVYVYDLGGTGPKHVRTLGEKKEGRIVHAISYSPDQPSDERILVAHTDAPPDAQVTAHATLWTRGGRKITELSNPLLPSTDEKLWTGAAFLPDRRIVAVGGLWDWEGRLLAPLPGHEGAVTWISAGGHGRFLTAALHGNLQIWDRAGKWIRNLPLPTGGVRHGLTYAEFDSTGTGQRVLMTFQDGKILVWDVDRELPTGWQVKGPRTVLCARFSPAGDRIVAGNWGGTVQVFDIHGTELHSLEGHKNGVWWVSFSPDGAQIASASWDGTARIWPMKPLPGVPLHTGHGWPWLAISPSGQHVAFTSSTRKVVLCDSAGKQLRGLPVYSDRICVERMCVDFSRDENTVVVSRYEDGKIQRFDLQGCAELPRLEYPGKLLGQPPQQVAAGWWLVYAMGEDLLYRWRPGDGPEGFLPKEAGRVSCFEVSHDGNYILTGNWEGTVQLWDLRGRELRSFGKRDQSPVFSVAFSRDDRYVLAAKNDNNAYLWDLRTKYRRVYSGHQNGVVHAVFSRDGKLVATASQDKTIRVWDRESGAKLWQFRGDAYRLGFTASGQLVSGGGDGSVCWWRLGGPDFRDSVEKVGVPGFTEDERAQYADLLGK